MWKRLEDLAEQHRAAGLPDAHDPFEAMNTFVVRVERLTLEGESAVLAVCCESARFARADVLGWREVRRGDGAALYEVQLRRGAPLLVQRAARAERDGGGSCPRCGRGWSGLLDPDERWHRDRRRARDHHGHGCGSDGRGHGHHERHGHRPERDHRQHHHHGPQHEHGPHRDQGPGHHGHHDHGPRHYDMRGPDERHRGPDGGEREWEGRRAPGGPPRE